MDRWMDGWMNGWMDGWMDKRGGNVSRAHGIVLDADVSSMRG